MKTGLIVEDRAENRLWLGQTLAHCFPALEIGYAATVAEARAWLATHPPPDIALVDLGLPDGSGIELIELMSRTAAHTRTIVTTIYDDDAHLFPALRAGAQGYLLKDQSVEEASRLLEGIAKGQPPLSPGIARRILLSFQPSSGRTDLALPELSTREREVLRLISKGLTLAETARLLELSRHTVGDYVKDIYRKLNVSSRAEAAVSAQQLGLV